MSVAPKSIMPVDCKEYIYGLVVMVGLKLSVLVNGYLDFIKLKLCVLTVPHCHKALLQPGGRLFLFLDNS